MIRSRLLQISEKRLCFHLDLLKALELGDETFRDIAFRNGEGLLKIS